MGSAVVALAGPGASGAAVARIELRHGHQIVPAAAAERDGHHAIVDVATMEDLARLADQHGP